MHTRFFPKADYKKVKKKTKQFKALITQKKLTLSLINQIKKIFCINKEQTLLQFIQ